MKNGYLIFSFVTAVLINLAGCTMINVKPYEPSASNIQELKEKYGKLNTKITLGELRTAPNIDDSLICRVTGPIEATPGKTIPTYIKDAFKEELTMAGLYADNGDVAINGVVEEISFSSQDPGYWKIALTVSSDNDKSYTTESTYQFKSAFDAWTACANVANAFGPAVQALLNKVESNPEFERLLNK